MSPMSTSHGKGSWGPWEGIQAAYHLDSSLDAFFNNPLNYQRVQTVLDLLDVDGRHLLVETHKLHDIGFSGMRSMVPPFPHCKCK